MNVSKNARIPEAFSVVTATWVASLLVLAFAFTPTIVAAQPDPARAQASATVTKAAPIYLLPDATRKPLRTLPVGTTLTVMQIRGEWVEITFIDQQFGRRAGWVQREFIRVNPASPAEEAPKPPPPTPATPPTKAGPPVRTGTAQPATPAQRMAIGFRGFGTIAFDKLSASESFKAITEKDTTTFFGGGVQVTNLWRGLFAELAFETTSLDGERIFIDSDETIFRLGIPVEIKMRPVDVVAGWRTAPFERFTTYGAAGATFLSYEETSEFADAAENVKTSKTGFILLGGVEVRVIEWVHVRGEVRYRSIKDAIGVGGVSAVFDESDLGGAGFALKIVVGR